MTSTQRERSELAYARRVLTVSAVGAVLSGVNTSTMDVALPVVSRHFDASASGASWTLLAYMLVNTALIFVFGRVADMVGRRRLYLIGLATLTGGSLLCGFAPTIGWLIGFRVVQAVGAAALLCNVTALITDAFPVGKLSTALGINVSIAALAQVLGPVIGGALVTGLGWRAVFLFNVPIGVAGLVWARLSLRPGAPPGAREPFDYLGALLSTLALGGLVAALSEGGAIGWTSTPVLVGALLFALATPAFLLVESRRRHPLLDLRLFADRERSLAYLSLFLMALARFAVVLLVSLYLQAARGMGPFQAGVHVMWVAIGMAAASPLVGRLAQRYGARLLSSAGMAITAAGLLGLCALIAPDVGEVGLGACLLAIGVGSGTFMTPNTSAIMVSVAAGRRGIANGVRQTTQNAGYVVSTALSLAIVTTSLSAADKRAAYAGTLSRLSRHALGDFTSSYRLALLVLAGVCLVGIVASLSRNPQPTGGERRIEQPLGATRL